jgi:hypothetical protein
MAFIAEEEISTKSNRELLFQKAQMAGINLNDRNP